MFSEYIWELKQDVYLGTFAVEDIEPKEVPNVSLA